MQRHGLGSASLHDVLIALLDGMATVSNSTITSTGKWFHSAFWSWVQVSFPYTI